MYGRLHLENVIRESTSMQVIDVEEALFNVDDIAVDE